MSFDSIPVLDITPALEPEPDAGFAARFTEICHHVGFAIVTGHGVPQRLIDDTFAMMRDFFVLDEADKRLIDKRRSPQFRGWEPVGAESTNNAPDIREQIDVWTEWPVEPSPQVIHHRLYGPNQWLTDDVLAGHRERSLRWIDALANVADRLMAALAVGLGLEPDHFRDLFGARPMSLAKFIHYPPTPEGGAGVNPHHDTGFITVLAPGPTPGLQVQNPDGDWIDVPIIDGALVINLGEILQSMTANYLVATPHRVVTATERLSAGYFHGPSLDTPLDRLPLDGRFAAAVAASAHHRQAGFMPPPAEAAAGTAAMQSDYRPTTYGEQLWNYFSRSYPALVAAHHGDV